MLTLVFGLSHSAVCVSAKDLVRANLLLLPNSRDAIDQLQEPESVSWENVPFRQAIEALIQGTGLSVWIDRRIDANQLISAEVPVSELENCLRKIAVVAGAEFGLVENVIIFAPSGQASAIETAAVRLHDLLSRAAERKSRVDQRPIDWSILTTPQELLAKIGRLWEVKIESALPHDLMAAGELVPCTLATQVSLLMGGFGLQFNLKDDGTLFSEPLAKEFKWRSDYASGELQLSVANRIQKDFPNAAISTAKGQSEVFGSTAFHRQLLAHARQHVKPKAASLEQRSIKSFEGRATVTEVVNYLAKHFGLKSQWDPAITAEEKQKIVNLSITKPTPLDDVFSELGIVSALSFKRSGETLTISRK